MQLLVRTMALHGRTGSGSRPHPILSWDTTNPGDMFCASTPHVCTQSTEGTQHNCHLGQVVYCDWLLHLLAGLLHAQYLFLIMLLESMSEPGLFLTATATT